MIQCSSNNCNEWHHITCALASGLCSIAHSVPPLPPSHPSPWTLFCSAHSRPMLRGQVRKYDRPTGVTRLDEELVRREPGPLKTMTKGEEERGRWEEREGEILRELGRRTEGAET